ncbi:MaoC/PaaZ C-terminal domain-containing protein [Vannielia sp.]|uniref:MaoC/PaaZ C-terminal domain-containing protein n=1 Tax=Vannielia sp. TaxID=2813045 RepID=UPI002631C992|nr:MaoC/PaaZ C-terminal domain-containing protein [Vannielia sp.]MDF1872878.1 MaoC/PaaZ C-terminal domain-containing protein [Vannielia sp.]
MTAPAPRSFGPITRAQLRAFAEASGDRNPLHLDPAFAQAAGYKDVLAHGMLAMGALTRLVTDHAAASGLTLKEINCRFADPMPLGCTLTLKAEPAEDHLTLTATTEAGSVVLRGRARLGAP